MSVAAYRPCRLRVRLLSSVAAALLAGAPLAAQATGTATPLPAPSAAASTPNAVDLQGLWDFTMRAGDRMSPGFFALGPVDGGWAGSITMYLTNTLAVRRFTIEGDSIAMVVASREGDVTFRAQLSDGGNRLSGIVEYHGGARLPLVAHRRIPPVVPR